MKAIQFFCFFFLFIHFLFLLYVLWVLKFLKFSSYYYYLWSLCLYECAPGLLTFLDKLKSGAYEKFSTHLRKCLQNKNGHHLTLLHYDIIHFTCDSKYIKLKILYVTNLWHHVCNFSEIVLLLNLVCSNKAIYYCFWKSSHFPTGNKSKKKYITIRYPARRTRELPRSTRLPSVCYHIIAAGAGGIVAERRMRARITGCVLHPLRRA